MDDLLFLSQAQMRRIEPYFPLSHGIALVDDRRVLSGILFVIRNGLRWRDVPAAYGPPKTICNRFIGWSRLGVFNRIFAELAADSDTSDRLMIDATHINAHRTAASLLKKGLYPAVSDAVAAGCHRPSGEIGRTDLRPPERQWSDTLLRTISSTITRWAAAIA